MILRDFWRDEPLKLEQRLNVDRVKVTRPHQRNKMFVPAISTLLWVLVYSWPAEVASNPLNVATSPADLQLLKGPQVANFTSNPELLITQAVDARRSEVFPIRGTNYKVELTSPEIEKTIAVEAFRDLLRRGFDECQTEVARGRADIVPFTMSWIGPAPDNLEFTWYNLDQRRGSYEDLIDIFAFFLFIGTTERIPRPNPWFTQGFSYVVDWLIDPSGVPEIIGLGTLGL